MQEYVRSMQDMTDLPHFMIPRGIFLFGQHIDLLELVQTTELDGELNLG